MREQKYKDILEKYEESNFKESEEKLSMTRELKFKDLQDSLKEEVEEVEEERIKDDLTVTREMKFSDIISKEDSIDDDKIEEIDRESTLKESADVERELDEALEREINKQKNFKVKEVPSEEMEYSKSDEDIYLTTSFKPFRKRFRFRKVFKVFFLLLILIGGIGALTYYVVLPVYHKFMDSRPKMIFDHTIDYVDKEIEKVFDTVFTDDDTYYNDFNFKIDTNIDELDILSDNTYGYQLGVNPKEQVYEAFWYVKENKDKYGLRYIEKDLKKYMNVTGSSSYLEMGEIEEDDNEFYNSYAEYLEELSLGKEDMKYVLNKEFSILKELLEEDLITSKKDELEVNGKTTKVVKNSFTVGKKDMERLDKKYFELVKEDKKLVKLLAEMEELDEDEYLEQLEEEVIEEYEDDFKLIISIYTRDGTKFTGFDIEENGFRVLYYYTNIANEFDFYINMTENEDCLEGKDCVASEREIYEIEGRKNSGKTELSIKYNSIEYATLSVDSFSSEKIKFDYKIFIEDTTIKGDFLLYLDNEKKEYNLDLSIKVDGQYVNLKFFIGLKQLEPIGYIDEDKILKYTDKVFVEEWDDFADLLESKGLDEGFAFWYNLNFHPDEILEAMGFEMFFPNEGTENIPNDEVQTM